MEPIRKIDLQLFADGDPAPEPGDDGTGDDSPEPQPKGGGGKTFTQEELDAIVQRRLARERKQWEQQLEEERKKAAMTEAERLKAEKAEAEQKAQSALEAANERLIRAEVRLQVAELGIVDADAAYALMDREDVVVDEHGNVQGVREALEALLKAKPWLKKQGGTVGGGTNPPGGGDGGDPNPWSKGHWNLTQQGRIMRENPQLAERLKREAGIHR